MGSNRLLSFKSLNGIQTGFQLTHQFTILFSNLVIRVDLKHGFSIFQVYPGHEVEIVTEEGREQARTQLKTMSRRRWESRQADKGKEPDEGASLIPGTSGETVTEAQVGTVTEAQSGMVTDEQEQRQPTTARRKTTSKRRRPSDEVDKVKDQDEEAPLSSGTPVDAVTDEKQQTTARVKTTRKRNGEASKVDKAL